jgi:predicted HTH domain antitoxin
MAEASVLEELDLLIQEGIYEDRDALLADAVRALLRSRPELRQQLAVALYKRGQVSLARGAEVAGVDGESFKELLREAGVLRRIEPAGEALKSEVEALRRLRG